MIENSDATYINPFRETRSIFHPIIARGFKSAKFQHSRQIIIDSIYFGINKQEL